MATLVEIKQKLKRVFDERQATVLAEVLVDAYGELVKSGDFNELKAIVKELAEAQKGSEQRLSRIEVAVAELTEAQKRTEQRVEELAEAQKRTEDALQKLVQDHRETRRQLGGLAMTVGYTLENEAFKALPELLQRDFGITVTGRLKRQYVTDNQGRSIEVNIVGEAARDGREVIIIGEAKSQLSKNDVDNFVRRKLDRFEGVFKEVFPVLITHMVSAPDVEEYVRQKGMALYYSYDF